MLSGEPSQNGHVYFEKDGLDGPEDILAEYFRLLTPWRCILAPMQMLSAASCTWRNQCWPAVARLALDSFVWWKRMLAAVD